MNSSPTSNTPHWTPISIDNATVAKRCARVQKRSIKSHTKKQMLRLALSMVDLTTLEGKDTPQKVHALCRKAMHPAPEFPDLPHCAAVCVYPNMVSVAKQALGEHSGVNIAAVATGFPAGLIPMDMKIAEVKKAVALGANEIDMVINRGAFLAGEYNRVYNEILEIKEACGEACLKVILETGELGTLDNIALASRIAIDAQADFIKTSTGKIQPASTLEVTLVMLHAIRESYQRTGRPVGMKSAGGIRKAKQALHYLVLVGETLGPDWLTPNRFRFGASSLVNDLLKQIAWKEEGHYASSQRFSVD